MSALDAWYSHSLRGLSALISSAVGDDGQSDVSTDTYTALIKAALESYGIIKPEDIEKEFNVSASTVARWKSGQSAPFAALRPIVLEWLKERVDEKAGTRALSRDEIRTFEAAILDGRRIELK